MIPKKLIATIVISILLIQIAAFIPFAASQEVAAEKKQIKIALHVVKGSGVTKEQMEGWVEKANKVWGCSLNFTIVSTDEVNNVGDNKVAGAVNVYGSGYSTDPLGEPCKNPGNPGRTPDTDYIEVGRSAPEDTLAHELGHWFGAVPDNTAGEHGTPTGAYPGYPGYQGSDTDGDGDQDADDRGNIMYPGKARTGQNVDGDQQKRARHNADTWLDEAKREEEAARKGSRKDGSDTLGDVDAKSIDIIYVEAEATSYSVTFTLIVDSVVDFYNSFYDGDELGFLIESDNNPDTGEPLYGLDYYVAFDPATELVLFNRFDAGQLTPLDPGQIAIELIYMDFDAPIDPAVVGVRFTLPQTLLGRRAGNTLSFVARARTGSLIDISPNVGLMTITLPSPKITVTPNRGFEHYVATIRGTDFGPSGFVNVTVDGSQVVNDVEVDAYGSFDTSLVVPVTTPGVYNVTAIDTYGLSASSTLTVVDVSPLDVKLDVGSIYFRSEITEFYALTSFNGTRVNATINYAALYYSNGTLQEILTANVVRVATGLYRVPFTVPINATEGMYVLVVDASYVTSIVESKGTSLKGFLLSPTLTQWNAWLTSIEGDVGILKTDVRTIRVDVAAIKPVVTKIDGDVVTLKTDVGTMKADVTVIKPTLSRIEGDVATITTLAGAINGTVTDIKGDVLVVKTDVGTIKVTIGELKPLIAIAGPVWGAAVFSLIAAIGAIASAVLILRRARSKA